jgi:MFS family permease
MALSIALGAFLSLAAGAFVDTWQRTAADLPAEGYSILFLAGCAAGLIGIIFLSRIPEPRLETCRQVPIAALFRESLADRNFRHLLSFLALWNFAINLAAPFFTVYLLTILGLDVALVVALAVLSQVVSVASFHLWGYLIDKYSNKSVLRVSGPLYMICILGWTFTTLPGEYALTMPLLVVLHILMGAATAGVTLASSNIGLKLASKEAATAQLATISVTNSLVAAVAPVIGGLTIDYVALHELDWILVFRGGESQLTFYTLSLQHWDFFFVIAFVVGLYSLHLLAYLREEGEAGNRVVVRELVAQVRREMRNFSTIGGLRYLHHPPIAADRRVCETPPEDPRPQNIDRQA